MLFENEKENIDNLERLDISDDNSVDWAQVLNESEEIVPIRSVKSQAPQKKQEQTVVELGDELEIVNDEDDIDDEELMRVLNSSSEFSATGVYDLPEEKQLAEQEEFDLNAQINNAKLTEEELAEEVIIPRKDEEIKKSSPLLIVLLAILFAVLVVGGVYYIIDYTKAKNLNQKELDVSALKESEFDITKEELDKRIEENAAANAETADGKMEQSDTVEAVIKEDEKKQEEDKKQVIVVTPSGRSNPFLPASKYVQIEIPKAELDFEGLGIPQPPSAYPEENVTAQKMMTIAVSGIMYDEQKPSAIITFDGNDYFVQRGDRLDEYRVVDIARNYVAIAHGKNIYKAKVGEEFKIISDIDGSAKYIGNGQGKQYYSAGYLEETKSKHVSEDDVEIKVK